MNMASTEHNHVLYYSTFSVCSLMARLTFVYRGEAKDSKDEVVLKEEHVDIPNKEQLTEHFLCDVNPYGEVPVLVPVNGTPIPDSLDITLHLAKLYPSLMPPEYAPSIEPLIRELHEINFFSLSFPGKPASPLDSLKTLQERLGEDISGRYRAAIQVKMKRVQQEKLEAVSQDEVEGNVVRTKAIMDALKTVIEGSSTGWCFGLSRPSALDTHLLVFIARMQDVGWDDLIPDTLKQWADDFMHKDEWKNLMGGRRTLPPPLLVKKSP